MFKLIFFIIFIGASIIFAIIKAVGSGISAAYTSIFKPEQLRALTQNDVLKNIIFLVNNEIKENYEPHRSNFKEIVDRLVPVILNMAMSQGNVSITTKDVKELIAIVARKMESVPEQEIVEVCP